MGNKQSSTSTLYACEGHDAAGESAVVYSKKEIQSFTTNERQRFRVDDGCKEVKYL